MKRKRLRTPKAKPGQLKLAYGRYEGEVGIVASWGEGCSGREGSLLLHYVCGQRCGHGWQKYGPDPSLEQLLIDSGYDITTLKFSIEKLKKVNSQ